MRSARRRRVGSFLFSHGILVEPPSQSLVELTKTLLFACFSCRAELFKEFASCLPEESSSAFADESGDLAGRTVAFEDCGQLVSALDGPNQGCQMINRRFGICRKGKQETGDAGIQ